MSIYTKTGDAGTTAVFGGARVSKSDLQIEAYGCTDELSSLLGLLIAKNPSKEEIKLLTSIQRSLWQVMSHLAGASVDLSVLEQEVKKFEQIIDKITLELPELHSFILPQGGEITSLYHIARTTARRAERAVVAYFRNLKLETRNSKEVLKYLNRMSDLFFTLARKHGKDVKIKS